MVAVSDLAVRRSELAARFYGHPSKDVCCLGITGTNGKTSIAFHLTDLSQRLGVTSGYCGTLGWGELGHLRATQLTTPSAVALQEYLAAMRSDGVTRIAMEVSSHALDQGRVAAVHFEVAVFSNLTRDHLDSTKRSRPIRRRRRNYFNSGP